MRSVIELQRCGPVRFWFTQAGLRAGWPGLFVSAVPSSNAPPNLAVSRTRYAMPPWPVSTLYAFSPASRAGRHAVGRAGYL